MTRKKERKKISKGRFIYCRKINIKILIRRFDIFRLNPNTVHFELFAAIHLKSLVGNVLLLDETTTSE